MAIDYPIIWCVTYLLCSCYHHLHVDISLHPFCDSEKNLDLDFSLNLWATFIILKGVEERVEKMGKKIRKICEFEIFSNLALDAGGWIGLWIKLLRKFCNLKASNLSLKLVIIKIKVKGCKLRFLSWKSNLLEIMRKMAETSPQAQNFP